MSYLLEAEQIKLLYLLSAYLGKVESSKNGQAAEIANFYFAFSSLFKFRAFEYAQKEHAFLAPYQILFPFLKQLP